MNLPTTTTFTFANHAPKGLSVIHLKQVMSLIPVAAVMITVEAVTTTKVCVPFLQSNFVTLSKRQQPVQRKLKHVCQRVPFDLHFR